MNLTIPRDKLLHIGLGLLTALAAAGGILVYLKFGLGPALAYFTTVAGIGYEGIQKVRKEGQVEPLDALSTASPGWAAWLVLYLAGS